MAKPSHSAGQINHENPGSDNLTIDRGAQNWGLSRCILEFINELHQDLHHRLLAHIQRAAHSSQYGSEVKAIRQAMILAYG